MSARLVSAGLFAVWAVEPVAGFSLDPEQAVRHSARYAFLPLARSLIFMSVKQFAAQFKKQIEDINARGTASIYCDSLIAYFDSVVASPDAEPSALSIEEFKSQLQDRIERAKLAHQSDLEMFKSVIEAGQNAIKTALTLNGAAAVAMLAFIGHLARFERNDIALFAACLVPFATGALAITISSGATYLSQWLYAEESKRAVRAGFWFNMLAIVLGLTSYGLFIWGLVRSYDAFLRIS
jgi:hypothetical protein